MYYSFCQHLVYHMMVVYTLSGINYSVVNGRNYPAKKAKPKPCTRLNNTITYQDPICEADGKGGFFDHTVDNCVGPFKATCPEFNKARCEMYKGIPCCRLKYYAKKRTWMEVYYTNQYNVTTFNWTIGPVYDVIEIHRKILKTKYFGDRVQPDWPNNALNSDGERGLKWTLIKNLSEKIPPIMGDKLCGLEDKSIMTNFSDTRCSNPSGAALTYMMRNYPEGFGPVRDHIKLSKAEAANNVTETISLLLKCIRIVAQMKVVPACQVLYKRNATYNGARYATSFIYLEANIFESPDDKEMAIRYAYWSQENEETRDKIFGTG